jgi:deoxyribodipyrimidine photolyase-related protein
LGKKQTQTDKGMTSGLVILGDQLFPIAHYRPYRKTPIFMAEDHGLLTHYRYHQHKLIFFLTAMRSYADELREAGYEVSYHSYDPKKSFLQYLKNFVKKNKLKELLIPEIQDKFFETLIFDFCIDEDLKLTILSNPMFLCPREEFKAYLGKHKKPFMKVFYEQERKRLNVLLDSKGKPLGGKWSFDEENRKKAPKVLTDKGLLKHTPSPHLHDVLEMVSKNFSEHPGSVENFWLPTTRKDALRCLQHFIKNHLKDFGTYQDAITNRSPFMYHSILSPMINMGLITPLEVVEKVEEALRDKGLKIPMNAAEGFIRQVIGWREFVRGIYQNFSHVEETRNFFDHQGKLTEAWYQGSTGLPPVDDAIKKAQIYGYNHHIERLMVVSNVMLLSELHPREVHRWFMEMFVDSADWVMGPNVYGMGQFSDGGIFATKPYFSGSNYILKMSDYKKGEWCDVWDGLFWRFIGNHQKFFSKQPRLNFMVKTLEKMEKTRRTRLLGLAQEFIDAKTLR